MPELDRVTEEISGAAYENDSDRDPLCSETKIEEESPSEIPGETLHTTEVPETCITVAQLVEPMVDDGW